MIKINRLKVHNSILEPQLMCLLNLQLSNFDDCVYVAKLLDYIRMKVGYIKTAYFLQCRAHGGDVIHSKSGPPYYKFDEDHKEGKATFESMLMAFLSEDEIVEEFDLRIIELSQENFNKLSDSVQSDLSGIIELSIV